MIPAPLKPTISASNGKEDFGKTFTVAKNENCLRKRLLQHKHKTHEVSKEELGKEYDLDLLKEYCARLAAVFYVVFVVCLYISGQVSLQIPAEGGILYSYLSMAVGIYGIVTIPKVVQMLGVMDGVTGLFFSVAVGIIAHICIIGIVHICKWFDIEHDIPSLAGNQSV